MTTGTNLSPSIIEKFGKNYTQYNFFYRKSNLKEIQKSLDNNYPVIVVYNPSIIMINEFGPSHAGVVTGINDGEIILNNPWYGHGFYCDTQQFNDSWELEYWMSLYIRPNLQRELEE